jgi:hypothetical protein
MYMNDTVGIIMAADTSAVIQPVSLLENDVVSKSEQRVFENRYAKPKKSVQPLVYEFTRDPGYLHQYYVLRERMYAQVLGLKSFSGEEDEYDRQSHILILRRGNMCVGGARLTVKGPRQTGYLPMEEKGFVLSEIIPEIAQKELKYSEVSRLAVLSEFSGNEVTKHMFWHLNRKRMALGVPYVFCIASPIQVRLYRRHATSVGIDFSVLNHIQVPDKPIYEGIKMCLHMHSGYHPEKDELAHLSTTAEFA